MIVIIDHPLFCLFPDLRQRSEDIAIQQLSSETAVKTFNSCILRWFAWADEVKYDPMLFTPEFQPCGDELRAVVQSDDVRLASPFADVFKRLDHSACRQRSVYFNIEYLSVEFVDHVEQTAAPAVPERIAHKVHRPDMIWNFQRFQRRLDSLGQTLFCLTADVEPQLPIDAVYPLVVPHVTRVAYSQEQFTEAVSRMLLSKVIQDVDDFLIVTLLGLVVKRASIEAHCCTRLTEAQIMLGLQIRDRFTFLVRRQSFFSIGFFNA